MSSKEEVVIVGAGVIGCSIAYHLAKKGVPSRIIERDSIGSQASGRAWAVVSAPASMEVTATSLELSEESFRSIRVLREEGFRQLGQLAGKIKEEGGLDIGYSELPQIRCAFQEDEERRYKKRTAELQKEGFEISWIEGEEIVSRYPDVAPGVRGGLLMPGHRVEPYKYTLALAQAAEKMGVNITQGEVVRFRTKGTKCTAVTLATGTEVEADIVVLAMGPWAGQGTSRLGKEIPIKVMREQALRVEVSQQLPQYRLSVSDSSIIPWTDGTVVLGCALALEEVEGFNDSPTEEAATTLMEAAVRLVPRLTEARLIEHRSGLEAWPPTGYQPVLGRLPEWDNVYIAGRLQTMGISFSAPVGRIMADLITTGHIEKSIEHLTPARLKE